MSHLILVRHGLSEYNKLGLWAGWDNPPLTSEGVAEAIKAGKALFDMQIDYAYTSDLLRAEQTLDEILKVLNQHPPITVNAALRERDYGDYTKKNKWEIKEQIGEEEFQKLRRSWDYPIPNGESLKMVYERELPYFTEEILPKLHDDKTVIISSSHNALRALIKYLEHIPDEEIGSLEMGTGEVYLYEIGSNGRVISKEIRAANVNEGKV